MPIFLFPGRPDGTFELSGSERGEPSHLKWIGCKGSRYDAAKALSFLPILSLFAH